MASDSRLLSNATAGDNLGPIEVTVSRRSADRFLERVSYGSAYFAPGGAGEGFVPCGALGDAYTDMLEHAGFYFLNAVQARCEEEYLRPVLVGEPLTCTGRIAGAGTTKSGLAYVDIEARVEDATGEPVFRSQNRLVVSREDADA